MRVPEPIIDDTNLFIDECKSTSHTIKQEHDHKPSPSREHLYTKIVKAIGNTKLNDEKPLLKRASWSPAEHQAYGLPPTGKRTDGDHSTSNKTAARVRMRSKLTRNYQLQQPHDISLLRPTSFNENYERLSNQSLTRNQRRELAAETLLPITTHVSPAVDHKNDFLRDTSNVSSNTSLLSSTKPRPLLNVHQQKDTDGKFVSPVLNPNPVPFTCRKGQAEKTSPSSLIGSSLNQYPELTSQTSSIDSSPDDSCHPTTTTTRSIMTLSISPNRHHHHQTHSSMTNHIEGLKPQQDQTESTIISGGCLKSTKTPNPHRTKKSVHFDWHSPSEIRSTSSNYHPSVTVTSSSLSIDDHNEEKEKTDGETVKEKERIETTRRTIMPTTIDPLTIHPIHRSFSLSPSPLSKEENSSNRRHRQVKKEIVDELNCTSNRQVTFNSNISPTKKSNGMKNFNGSENLTHQMPLNTLLVQNSTKKAPVSNGFLNFMTRSNSNNPSTSRKSKSSGNKRLSTDLDSLTKEDIDKVTINRQKDFQLTRDNNISSSNSSSTTTDSSNPSYTNNHLNRSSISMSSTSIKSDQSGDSLNNGLLFQPLEQEAFYLSPPKSPDHSSIGMMMQTSTLIISTPPQYHYYLYPPSISKKNSTTNISMNSLSTNSSSSSSYDLDDDTLSYSTYSIHNQNKLQQFKPIILSDSVQNFWPPPPSPSLLNNDSEQINSLDQNVKCFSSTSNGDDSLPKKSDVLPPSTSLILNNKEKEVRKYSEESLFSNGCLRIASDSSIEDTQASYSERLREKSRTINRPVAMNVNNYSLSRSRSKETLNNRNENVITTTTRNTFRPKSAGQTRIQPLLSPIRQEISNDFQSKRQFFENCTNTDNTHRIYTNSPINHQQQRPVTKCSWNDLSSRQPPPPPPPPQPESMIRTTKYFDSFTNQLSLPPTIYRKPVRIVKAVQRSAPSPTINDCEKSFSTKMTSDKDCLNDIHLSSQYIRNLFPIPDHLKHQRSRLNSDHIPPTEDLLLNLKTRLEILKDNQRIINHEIEMNTLLGIKLMKIIESKGELNEIEKLKLHINEIETITSVLLKLSCRLAKVENDLLTMKDDNTHTKANLLEQREKIQQKHDEAKYLKDGIDRRSRLVTNLLHKYLSDEQFDDYDYFIRMKSTLLMDNKDLEEKIIFLQKQLQHFLTSSSISPSENSHSNCKSISTTA